MSKPTEEFLLPNDLQLPKELEGEAPRSLPESLQEGPLLRAHKKVHWSCLAAGGLSIVLGMFPFVRDIGLYFLPFAYLSWIGIGICLITMASLFMGGEPQKTLAYVQSGQVAYGKIVELVKSPSAVVNGVAAHYAFHALTEMTHPETDSKVFLDLKSRDFSAETKDFIETRFRVGDFVPVVWMKNRFDSTCQIYDFLELTPQSSLERFGRAKGMPFWYVIVMILFVTAFLGIIVWNIYGFERYLPLDFDFAKDGFWPLVSGAIGGVVLLSLGWFYTLRQREAIEERNSQAASSGRAVEIQVESGPLKNFGWRILLLFGAVLLGGITTLSWCFTANAVLDESPSKRVPVVVTEMVQETYSLIFRNYRLKYHRHDKDEDDSFLTTPQHLERFQLPLAELHVREGWLGWPWVERVEPMLVDIEQKAD